MRVELEDVKQIIEKTVTENRSVTEQEYSTIAECAADLSNQGTDEEKRTLARILHNAVDQMLAAPLNNQLASDNYQLLELYFRNLCPALLRHIDSFSGSAGDSVDAGYSSWPGPSC